MTTIALALQQAQRLGVERIDAQLLLLHVVQQPQAGRAWLLSHDGDVLTPEQEQQWNTLVARRLHEEPVAYLRGYHEFFGLKLAVDARVLDPRPDTETLVEWALELLPLNAPAQVLDMGTGSGAIALALKSQRPHAQLTATDASPDALQVAQHNAQQLQLPVQFLLASSDQAGGTWFDAVPPQRFDLIVSNPPYIRDNDAHLAALQHEPLMALTSGADGLTAIRHIAAGAPAYLQTGAWLLLEHGYDQAEAVQTLLHQQGFSHVQSRRDLAGNWRCTGGQWLGTNP
mgnify:CR=1 FL=1